MNTYLTKSATASELDRLRSGVGTPAMSLTAQAITRPGAIEKFFASKGEKAIMGRRDLAVAMVETEQIAAAEEVAVARIRDTKEVALKANQAETARLHAELEGRMQNDSHEADANDAAAINRFASELFQVEKAFLDGVNDLAANGRIIPERAPLLAEIAKASAERVMRRTLNTNEKVGDIRDLRIDRTLSIKR